MKMLDTTMSYNEIEEAIAYMLPYLDNDDKRQIKHDLDKNSIIFTKKQYESLCAALYAVPSTPVYNEFEIQNDAFYDNDLFDSEDYVSYVSSDIDYSSIQPAW